MPGIAWISWRYYNKVVACSCHNTELDQSGMLIEKIYLVGLIVLNESKWVEAFFWALHAWRDSKDFDGPKAQRWTCHKGQGFHWKFHSFESLCSRKNSCVLEHLRCFKIVSKSILEKLTRSMDRLLGFLPRNSEQKACGANNRTRVFHANQCAHTHIIYIYIYYYILFPMFPFCWQLMVAIFKIFKGTQPCTSCSNSEVVGMPAFR